MDTGRLKALITRLEPEFANVQFWIEWLAKKLDGTSTKEKVNARGELERRLQEAPSNSFVPSWQRMIAALGGRRLHGRALWNRIAAALDADEYSDDAKSSILYDISTEVEKFTSTLQAIRGALARLRADELQPDEAEVGVLFPLDAVAHADKLSAEVAEFERHLRTFWKLAGREGDVRLRRLDNASADFFWSVALEVGLLSASALWGIALLREKTATARKLEAETRKLDAEAADILRKRAVEDAEIGRREIQQKLMAASKVDDAARRNELDGFTKHAIRYFEARIELGVIFEVRAPDVPGTPDGEAQDEAPRHQKVIAQIREKGSALAPLDIQLQLPLLVGETKKNT